MTETKEIVGFKSINGGYFEIWKAEDGYHLKNKYTVVPNEFKFYNNRAIKRLFDGLRRVVTECIPVDFGSGHPNSCMRVIFADKTEAIFKEQEGTGNSMRSYMSDVAEYSEFAYGQSFYRHFDTITIEHLRWVIKTKTESLSNVINFLKDIIEDDYIDIVIDKKTNGIVEISAEIYGIKRSPFMKVFPNGTFENSIDYPYLNLLKEYGIRLI